MVVKMVFLRKMIYLQTFYLSTQNQMKKTIIVILICVWQTLSAQNFYEIIQTFQADKSALQRKYPNRFSEIYFNRFEKFYSSELNKMKQINHLLLNQEQKIDYALLKNHIEKSLYFHQIEGKLYNEVKSVGDDAKEIYSYLEERKSGIKPRSELLAATFTKVEKKYREKIKNLKSFPTYNSWQKAEVASNIISELKKACEEAFKYYNDYNPEYYWWMKTPQSSLMATLDEYSKALKNHFENTLVKDDGSGIIGKPIGRDALLKDLQFEFIAYTPEKLIEEANKQFAWCEAEMIKASEQLGYGKDWKKALEHVKQTYVSPGQWPEDVIKLANEAIDFVEKRDLVTVPEMAKESFRTVMLSAEAQKQSPFFLGGETIMVAYPTIDMEHDDKMMSLRGNNPHFSRATVQHELIPGHHLQQFMEQRYKPYRLQFNTPFWVEGWALYWEFNFWDKNFPRGPEDKIGMLFWRMHRCARIIFSLNYHLEKMTPKQCIDFLVEKVGHERANAEAEVRRSFTGRYGPLYQIAYMIGGLQFYKLKKDMVDTGKMTEKQFHDTILQNNTMPVEIVKAVLEKKELPEDYKTNWKFLD
jgi:uncharacterized protein (DUF885 family)